MIIYNTDNVDYVPDNTTNVYVSVDLLNQHYNTQPSKLNLNKCIPVTFKRFIPCKVTIKHNDGVTFVVKLNISDLETKELNDKKYYILTQNQFDSIKQFLESDFSFISIKDLIKISSNTSEDITNIIKSAANMIKSSDKQIATTGFYSIINVNILKYPLLRKQIINLYFNTKQNVDTKFWLQPVDDEDIINTTKEDIELAMLVSENPITQYGKITILEYDNC